MSKKRKIDFTLYENNRSKVIFRFYPRQSRCHGFDDEPPKDWNGVYKVYYSYKIFRKYKDYDTTEELFRCECDECSVIGEVADRIECIVNGKRSVTVKWRDEEHIIELFNNEIRPMGYGVSWIINERKDWNDETVYEIVLWKYNGIGYRIGVYKDRLEKFGKYLNKCCEYMLTHGDPI